MRNLRRGIYVLVLVAFLGAFSACAQGGGLFEREDVIVAFDREPGAELIGFYAAKGLGYYNLAAINAQFIVNVDRQRNIQNVVQGYADFGIASSLDLAAARAEGLDVVGVAAIYRYNSSVLVTLGDRLVKRPRDLRGKRIAVASLDLNSPDDLEFRAMLERVALNPDEMNFVATGLSIRDNLLLDEEVDVVTGFTSTRDLLFLQYQGYDARGHYLGEYGILVYPQVLFTTQQRIDEDPDFVQRFVEATLLGYQAALEDPEGAITLLAEQEPAINKEFELLVMNAQRSYLDPADAPVGWMNLSVWERSIAILPPEVSANVIVFRCYTNEFVENTWFTE